MEVLGNWSDDWIGIEDHVGTYHDPPVPAKGGIVRVR